MRSSVGKYAGWQKKDREVADIRHSYQKMVRKNGVVYPTFIYWRAKLEAKHARYEKASSKQGSFAELTDRPFTAGAGIEIVMGKAIIRFPQGFDPACLCVLGGVCRAFFGG